MRLLLDTAVVEALSEARARALDRARFHAIEPPGPDPEEDRRRRFDGWARRLLDADLHLSVVTVGELRRGIEALRASDPATANEVDGWLEVLLDALGERLIELDRAILEEWGRGQADLPLAWPLGLLAATARSRGLVLATRGVLTLAGSGTSAVDPWTGDHVTPDEDRVPDDDPDPV